MEESMSTRLQTEDRVASAVSATAANVAWHSLLWLVLANAIGVLLAVLLLVPGANFFLGEWTYGRWIMVHMNLELYGWMSLPLIAFLFHVYGADHEVTAKWCRPALWSWSTALGIGTFSWLSGHSTGKLFLDWEGYALGIFIAAITGLWLILVRGFLETRKADKKPPAIVMASKTIGLIVLAAVPVALILASSSDGYPPINPATGGPTGASQLESSLLIVLVTLLLPFGIAQRKLERSRIIPIAWTILTVHAMICVALGRSDASNHLPSQCIGLATILVWLPIVPLYFRAFEWNDASRLWRAAVLWWWAALLVSGSILFFPGVLDHFKFTDGLVGHSFVAMAGFASSLIVLVMVQLLGNDAWIFNGKHAFYIWHGAIAAYVIVMTLAGWREGFDPAFTIVPGLYRNSLYFVRLLTGVAMLYASVRWFVDCAILLRETTPEGEPNALERIA
jgi:cytochrome c oxidase cbb3-type subunit 1